MKKTKFSIYSTDYFFEWLFIKIKTILNGKPALKLSAIKLLAFIHWFKDIS
ncbi:hypothetical protein AB9K26_13845 [Psychroserpens sp. XS_ASV72]|uniref:hypothetical protein n=1 Tax=Psychroserpens sp. XS_ASV72 TaxID=3241293 RepID=UPI003513F2E2